ncbi:hypothetical protein GCM10019016_046640 [Streptomyces prasinosporus]|uniref:Uncharacterized protein n=1 Tax=Streptomyces prasinosporus TaxID=68256 RepID=A0ABP6TTY9_9ACTN
MPQPDAHRSPDAVDVAAAAAAALDGAVLHGMPPSPVVADLTQGVRAGDREPTTPTPVPAARPQQDTPKQGRSKRDAPAKDEGTEQRERPPAGVLDMTKAPPARDPATCPPRAEQLQLSGDITYSLPSLDLLHPRRTGQGAQRRQRRHSRGAAEGLHRVQGGRRRHRLHPRPDGHPLRRRARPRP